MNFIILNQNKKNVSTSKQIHFQLKHMYVVFFVTIENWLFSTLSYKT